MAMEPSSRSFYLQIQPDWSAAGEDESCWLDVYERSVAARGRAVSARAGSTQYQLSLRADPSAAAVVSAASSLDQQQQEQETLPTHLVEVVRREKRWIEVAAALPAGNARLAQVRTVFQAPTDAFDLARSLAHPINSDAKVDADGRKRGSKASLQLYAVDVSSDERFVAVGAANGTCLLWDQQTCAQMLPLAGHVADVTAVRFFPSSQVLLSGSLDFTLRIWSVTGRCAATLRGHVGGVEDVAIIGRGRNVASCGSDGLIQLWSCASQSAIARWANDASSAVHCLSILQDTTSCLLDDDTGVTLNDSESETEGKVLFAGLDNGEVLGVDIRARAAALNLDGSSTVLSCSAFEASELGGPMLYTGTEDGFLTAWDLRQTSSPLRVASRSSASIHSIAPSASGVWTAHGDGACCYWRGMTIGESESPSVSTELTGPEFDPVRGLAVAPTSGHVFTVCRDGEFRTYIPHYMD